MARVTVEDCLSKVDNRFQLVLVAAKRARQLSKGAEPFVEWENDKPTVVALREIEEDHITAAILDEKPEEQVDEMQQALVEGLEAELQASASPEAPAAPAPGTEES